MTVAAQRSFFSGVEYSSVALLELVHHVMTIVLHMPEQFKWIALIRFMAVAASTVAYAGWVWKIRALLVHWEKIGEACKFVELRASYWRCGI